MVDIEVEVVGVVDIEVEVVGVGEVDIIQILQDLGPGGGVGGMILIIM